MSKKHAKVPGEFRRGATFLADGVGVVGQTLLVHADAGLKADKAFMLRAVKVCGMSLEFAEDALHADEDVVLAAGI